MAVDLHMAQLELDVRSLLGTARDRGWLARRRHGWDDLGYLVHQRLAALFQHLSPQPFRSVEPREPHGSWLTVLGYTTADEARLRRRAAEHARPAELAACRLDGLRTKPMPASLFEVGRRFSFEVRTCPVVRLASEVTVPWCGGQSTFRKGAELDAYLHRRYVRGGEDGRETVYLGWLRERLAAAGGAALVGGRLHAFRRVRLLRRGREVEGRRKVEVSERPDALLTGTLEVTEGEAFATLLARGVGRHRAFGFGMLLLRPPDAAGG